MALNKQVWLSSLVENFYQNNSFVAKSVDDSMWIDNYTVHIPNAGSASGVVINRSHASAAASSKRTDSEITYDMDELTTNPVYIPNVDTVELSYDKRNSILQNDRKNLLNVASENMLYRWAPDTDHIIMTGGTAETAHTDKATGNRNGVCKADVMKLMRAMDVADVPENGRYLLLDAIAYAQLLDDLSEQDKWMFQNSANVQTGVLGNLYGFNIMKRSQVLRLTASTKAIKKWDAAGAATDIAAQIAWQQDSVSRAIGSAKMFQNTDDPTWYGDIYSFLLRTGGCIRRYDKKGVFMLGESTPAV